MNPDPRGARRAWKPYTRLDRPALDLPAPPQTEREELRARNEDLTGLDDLRLRAEVGKALRLLTQLALTDSDPVLWITASNQTVRARAYLQARVTAIRAEEFKRRARQHHGAGL